MKRTELKNTEAVARLKERLAIMPPLVGPKSRHVRAVDWLAYREILKRII